MSIKIGAITIDEPVILAPMSGVTDLPFRRLARQLGAGLVVSEMVASRELLKNTSESRRRLETAPGMGPSMVQLAGCDPQLMADAARFNEDLGARIIDINMGCPVKKVVGGMAGSALMRDERLAARILEATAKAVALPVTLKIRTGWDHAHRNAPQLARIAEACGIAMITVHGRTRDQRFNGQADWAFISTVKAAVGIPVIANGDVASVDDARTILQRSGADGVMIGRGAFGRPRFVGDVIKFLSSGERPAPMSLLEQCRIVVKHYRSMLSYYGSARGVRIARKHLGWYLEAAGIGGAARAAILAEDDWRQVIDKVQASYRRDAVSFMAA